MKQLLSILLICSMFFSQSLTAIANNIVANDPHSFPENNIVQNKNAVIVWQDNTKTDNEKSTELKEFQDNFSEDFNENYRPSKWEITKNIAKYLGKAFISDIKSYILFYPLFKVSQLISFLIIYLPTYAFYKKTGIDIPAKVSSIFTKNESLNIIGQNLYNVIPLTLASFLFKWGKDLYTFARS